MRSAFICGSLVASALLLQGCDGNEKGRTTTPPTPTPTNTAPVATKQSLSTTRNKALAITLAASDADGDALTVTIDANVLNGSLSGSGLNYTYTPNNNFQGGDRFNYRVSDGKGGTASATVDIAVVNSAPVATNQSFSTISCTRVAVVLNATDADGDALTYSITATPTSGTLSGLAPNYTYTPSSTPGSDSFSYTVTDGKGGSANGTASFTVADPTAVATGDAVAVSAAGSLVHFNRAAPATVLGSTPVICMAQGEQVVGIDTRPATAQLYALGSQGNLYVLDPATGKASGRVALKSNATTPISTCAPAVTAYSALSGSDFGVDFNPAVDRLRVVSDTGQNLRINVATGDTTVDCALNGGSTSASAAAYTNSFANPASTTLFYLDTGLDKLFTAASPNTGTLTEVGNLGVNAGSVNGFEIDGGNGIAYAALTDAATTKTSLYTVNLSTGVATATGEMAGVTGLRGLALRQPGAARVFALSGNNTLHVFAPNAPDKATTLTITGLRSGETPIGIDFRPSDGLLYLTGNLGGTLGGLYTVNTTTGEATFLRNLGTVPAGALFGLDFNPVVDRLRIVSDTENNYRCNVDSGAVTTDTAVTPASDGGSVVAVGYTNNFAGTASTALFYLDSLNNFLHTTTTPNAPTLTKVGTTGLGLAIAGDAGFDIAGGHNGLVLAAISTVSGAPSGLYNINLTTGAATSVTLAAGSVNQIGGSTAAPVKAIAIQIAR